MQARVRRAHAPPVPQPLFRFARHGVEDLERLVQAVRDGAIPKHRAQASNHGNFAIPDVW